MAVAVSEDLRNEVRRLLNSRSLDFFYSEEFGSANSTGCNDWREKLQAQVDLKSQSANKLHSISHSNFLGGAALVDATEGQIGFDLEETARVLPAVALRVSDEMQMALAPTPAALFVAKEAAFKSLRGPRQPKVLSEVEILEWSTQKYTLPLYNFTARLKGQEFQWLGACFEDGNHTVGLCLFPNSNYQVGVST